MEVNKTKKKLATRDVEAEGDANNTLKKLKKGKRRRRRWRSSLPYSEDEVSHLAAMILGVPVVVLEAMDVGFCQRLKRYH